MEHKKEVGASTHVSGFSSTGYRNERLVEAGEASESSDEGESEVFNVKARSRSSARSASNLHGTSSFDTASFSSVTPASPSITSVSQVSFAHGELPVRPIQCRSLLESNLTLGKNLHEVAGLPYAVAIKEIDNVTLDLVRGQQLMDDVLRHLEQVGTGLQNIQHEADILRAHCRSILPRVPTSAQGATFPKGASKLHG